MTGVAPESLTISERESWETGWDAAMAHAFERGTPTEPGLYYRYFGEWTQVKVIDAGTETLSWVHPDGCDVFDVAGDPPECWLRVRWPGAPK